jgi:hypothetical protein
MQLLCCLTILRHAREVWIAACWLLQAQHSGRKLTWLHHLSTADIKVRLGKRQHVTALFSTVLWCSHFLVAMFSIPGCMFAHPGCHMFSLRGCGVFTSWLQCSHFLVAAFALPNCFCRSG